MRKILAAFVLVLLGTLFTGPSVLADEGRAVPGMGRDLLRALPFDGQMERTGTIHLERIPITESVAHYRFDLPVGPGAHDTVRLHRVVREIAPWIPRPAARGAFLVHGDGWGFEATFLAGVATPAVPDRQNLAVFLAEAGIDVWGIDLRWALVPAGTGDLSFMADWGLDTALADVDLGLAVARQVRLFTGSGPGKLVLVGTSRGGQIGWAQVGAESARPAPFRHVRGFVSIENAFKPDDEAIRQGDCASHAALQDQIDAGGLATDYGVLIEIGELALAAPDDPSPFLPSLSNADLAEWLGASAGGGTIPHFHSVGGIVDPVTLVTELLYTLPEQWFTFVAGGSAYVPLRLSLDGAAIGCDTIDSPHDDHLADVDVPVLYLGVAGAYGAHGVYTTTLISSTDVTTAIVSESPDPEEDWGHNDPFLAEDAETLVWQPILDWIRSR